MKKNKIRDKFLDELRNIPIILIGCEKVGLSRNSIYRWRKKDLEFAKEMDKALLDGENLVNDMSESQLLTLIKEKNFPAITYWLRHHHHRYSNKLEISGSVNTVQELSAEQKKIINNALKMAGIDPNEKN